MGNTVGSMPSSDALSAFWTPEMDRVATQMHKQLTAQRSVALYDALSAHVADATVGGVVFWSGLATTQLFQRALKIGSATPILPTVIGTLAVASSSTLALHFASLPREIAEEVLQEADRTHQTLAGVWKAFSDKAQARLDDLPNAPYAVYMAMGVVCFKMLGGRMRSIAPSPYANLGAFHIPKMSLPATAEYANQTEAKILQELGRQFGCHTCGAKRASKYVGDHMPPKFVAKQMNERPLNWLLGREVPFRFYPQCQPCSNQQAVAVKHSRNNLKLHLSSLRLYHSAGFWLVLLCTGGLYVGGSSFHDMADVPTQLPPPEADEDEIVEPMAGADHTLLRALREREKELRRLKRSGSGIKTIDAELASIEECKKRLKANLKRSQELEQREQGWNDRFFRDSPSQPKRPQRSERSHDSVPTQELKEKKIRDERQQYGRAAPPLTKPLEPKRPGNNGRLLPMASLSMPPKEPEIMTTKEEKLRFKVLKNIDARETLIYQLNALILCTPVQESLVMASRPSEVETSDAFQLKPRSTMKLASPAAMTPTGPMSNAREATRLAQQLAADLQMSGIQCVEALVEWMLEAGAKADKPPAFLWRGRNYFLKMHHDLDFADPELRARGVTLDCFSPENPLCIRPDQKLGRVLAAQSIIREMVDVAQQEGEENVPMEVTSSRQNKDKGTGRRRRKERDPQEQSAMTKEDMTPAGSSKALGREYPSADLMIIQDEMETARSLAYSQQEEHSTLLRDAETENELVGILDESLQVIPPLQPQTSRTVAGSENDEYDNSFDDAEEDETQPDNDEDDGKSPEEPQQEEREEEEMEDQQVPPEHDSLPIAAPADEEEQPDTKQKEEPEAIQQDEQEVTDIKANDEPSTPTEEEEDNQVDEAELAESAEPNWWQDLQAQLSQLAPNSSSQVADLEACSISELVDKLRESPESLEGLMASSHVAALHQSGFIDALSAFDQLLECESAKELGYSSILWTEGIQVVDAVCAVVVERLQQWLETQSALVSEIELRGILDAVDSQFGSVLVALPWLERAFVILAALNSSQRGKRELPGSLSRLVKVFYPYLTSQSRDRLVSHWCQVSRRIFGSSISRSLESIRFLLDAMCRLLLLNVECLQATHGDQIDDSTDEPHATPKLSLVCDRASVLESSIASASTKINFESISQANKPPSYLLFPFFKSAFGEKRVDGVQVEEGEGKGPLKEWFTLVTADLAATWRPVSVDLSLRSEFDLVVVNGNKLVVDGLRHVLRPGFKLEWDENGQAGIVSRIINSCEDNEAYLLDRGASSHSFAVSHLRIYEPRTPVLEYIKASESYFVNSRLPEAGTSQQTLRFLGWFLGNALLHHCGLSMRLHPLLFDLLLDETRRVSLDDLQSLDPSLYTALKQMTTMKSSDFVSFLEFEDLSPSLSPQDYIEFTMNEKYGTKTALSWLTEVRAGFYAVYSPEELKQSQLSGQDIADLLCDSTSSSDESDFAIDQIFRVSVDPDFALCPPLRRAFWSVVNGFSPPLKRKLVKFITGVETLPQAGSEFLRIEMPFAVVTGADHIKTLQMLPQSHTCDNTLELPNYWHALCWRDKHDETQSHPGLEKELEELLANKLRAAAEYSEGYGLDGTSGTSARLSGLLPGTRAATSSEDATHQESFESLDLPGLGEGSGDHVSEADAVANALASSVTDEHSTNAPTRPVESQTSPEKAPIVMEEESYAENDWEEEELAD
ncbi:hypothetical protein Poli38472_003381 [Pythium oligandrum]|uniref:HECT domain-containing protein n=1 Tax=Pythium oligandrum TaxID=41045 RepID=A0A8K1C6F0_PYTOL|nr:hypothetical protein Poli38472_003381 [Pythium oligandrum]|eukprot:TMW57456.1 hypothetical protein Poli38472_003381 [Pythium oligandrum]